MSGARVHGESDWRAPESLLEAYSEMDLDRRPTFRTGPVYRDFFGGHFVEIESFIDLFLDDQRLVAHHPRIIGVEDSLGQIVVRTLAFFLIHSWTLPAWRGTHAFLRAEGALVCNMERRRRR